MSDARNILEEARAMARGDSRQLPTYEHLWALDQHAQLLERTIAMATLGAVRDMQRLEEWANKIDAESQRKVGA